MLLKDVLDSANQLHRRIIASHQCPSAPRLLRVFLLIFHGCSGEDDGVHRGQVYPEEPGHEGQRLLHGPGHGESGHCALLHQICPEMRAGLRAAELRAPLLTLRGPER